MLEMRLAGATYQSIADSASVSRQRIQQILSPPRVIRKLIVERAHGQCQDCGVRLGRSGHCHHVGDIMETYNDLENIRLLCLSCHSKAHNVVGNRKARERAKKRKDYLKACEDMDIKALRKTLKMTQEELAVKLGVAGFTVRRWEAGKAKPSPLARRGLARLEEKK